MEVPWAADLTHLGVAALFIDRRGHGRSAGSWWPRAPGSGHLADTAPDIRAAVAYLRSREPLVDPSRIALVGHSDGGTGVLQAASADWDVAATAALSASAAPWESVNHIAPANLLLLYGSEDHFVLNHTDELLIRNATRGYLDREGAVGSLQDGSARRLVRVTGRGHIDLLYSAAARREALGWIAETFRVAHKVVLSPLRTAWVAIGVLLLALLLLLWNGPPPIASMLAAAGWHGWLKTTAVVGLWGAGLAAAAWCVPRLGMLVPTQEGAVVVGVLVAESLAMGAAALAATVATGSALARRPRPSRLLRNVAAGMAVAILFEAAFEPMLRPVYETPISWERLVLCAVFFVAALPAFAALGATRRAVGGEAPLAPGLLFDIGIAVLTAAVAGLWFERMSALPVYLLACAVALAGAYRAAGHPGGLAGAAAFGALVYARCASLVCAWY
jgi:hypothetical protein